MIPGHSYSHKPNAVGIKPDLGHPQMQGIRVWCAVLERSGLEVSDLVGNGPATAVNAATIEGDQYMDLPYTTADYFRIEHHESNVITGAHTVSARLYVRQTRPWGYVISKGGAPGANDYGFLMRNNYFYNQIGNPAVTVSVSPYTIPVQTWTYVGYTWDGDSDMNIYYDGIPTPDSPKTVETSLPVVTQPVTIGVESAPALPFDGYIQDVRVYEGFKSSEEMYDMHTNPWAPFSSQLILPVEAAEGGVPISVFLNANEVAK